jgi:hypothetical protein
MDDDDNDDDDEKNIVIAIDTVLWYQGNKQRSVDAR